MSDEAPQEAWLAYGQPGQPPMFGQDARHFNLEEGEVSILVGSKLPQGPVRISQDGSSLEAIEPTLDDLKTEAWAAASAYRDTLIDGRLTATTDKGVFDYDAKGRGNIKDAIDAAAALGAEAPPTKPWRLHDNSVVDLTLDDFRAADLAGIMAKNACYLNSWTIEAQQQAAADAAALAAIDITAGYPA